MNNNTENKNKQQENGNERASQKSWVKRAFAKRWTFPVIYLAASVLIVGLMYAKSKDMGPFEMEKSKPNTPQTQEQAGPPAPGSDQAQQANTAPDFIWPVGTGGENAMISMAFFHDGDSDDQKAKEVVAYNNSFTPHEGVDIGLKSDAPFTVVAAAKGKVASVTTDPLMGNVVEIDHGNGYTTYYASLYDIDVKPGDNVLQGQPIAKSGNNQFEMGEKNHLHFELRKDGQSVDPNTVLSKKPIGDNATTTSGSTIGTPAQTEQQPADSSQPAAKSQMKDTAKDQPKESAQDQTQDTTQDQAGDPSTNSSDSGATDTNAGATDGSGTPNS